LFVCFFQVVDFVILLFLLFLLQENVKKVCTLLKLKLRNLIKIHIYTEDARVKGLFKKNNDYFGDKNELIEWAKKSFLPSKLGDRISELKKLLQVDGMGQTGAFMEKMIEIIKQCQQALLEIDDDENQKILVESLKNQYDNEKSSLFNEDDSDISAISVQAYRPSNSVIPSKHKSKY
jgi:hypothetical protein